EPSHWPRATLFVISSSARPIGRSTDLTRRGGNSSEPLNWSRRMLRPIINSEGSTKRSTIWPAPRLNSIAPWSYKSASIARRHSHPKNEGPAAARPPEKREEVTTGNRWLVAAWRRGPTEGRNLCRLRLAGCVPPLPADVESNRRAAAVQDDQHDRAIRILKGHILQVSLLPCVRFDPIGARSNKFAGVG